MLLSLNGEWSLFYHVESESMPPESEWAKIPAMVPGNIELDLARAGIEPDPFFGENAYKFRKYEYYTFVFKKSIFVPEEFFEKDTFLRFEGLNCIADVFVNDKHAGHSENALIRHEFPVSDLLIYGKENEIKVQIHSPINYARNKDYPVHLSANEGCDEFTALRMPAHSFGWDIMPRFLSAGMWRSVSLDAHEKTEITQTYYVTLRADEKCAEIKYKYRFKTNEANFDGFRVRITLDGVAVSERPVRFVSGEGSFKIENPRLWWPRGYGEAELYTVKMELLKDGIVKDALEERIGVRTAEVVHKMAANDDGEFLIRVNGVNILAKGSNWVPMDAMHSRDSEKYDRAVALFAEAGCNIMRLWGGNVYEDHKLFDLCDENGILVWHDFSMACAIYPQSPEFEKIIFDEAVSVIRKLRNHASILLWAGDNEVDEHYSGVGYTTESNNFNAITRQFLPRAVRENDPYRRFLPSSPYIADGVARYSVPEQHNWGPRSYFKDDFYRLTNAHFISECGYHGCPSPESIKKFIPKDELWPMNDRSWKTHNTEDATGIPRGYDRNELMANQVRIMFGFMPDTLDEFALLSQFTQAEAKKFFIERTRIKKWRRTGIIWWNMIDGWPQISDAVVDWYYVKKRAFNAIKHVQTPICIMLDEHDAWGQRVILGNDSRTSASVSYRIIDADTKETLLEGNALSPANENITLGEITILPGAQKLLLIEWTIASVRCSNHYLTGHPPYNMEKVRFWAKQIDEWNND